MKKIEQGGTLHELLPEGYVERTIDTLESLNYTLVCDKKTELFIQINEATDVSLSLEVTQSGQCSIFIWNESKQSIRLVEKYTVESNGDLKLAYGDLNDQNSVREVEVNLSQPGGQASIKSAVLAQSKKETKMVCTSFAPHTSCHIENYGVVTQGGSYYMDAIGAIKKGAYGSESHQTSRALTVNTTPQATIIPQLLIDENDVNASHATSIGQVDENQMIYLQSRGLTKDQVMELITVGYLLPIANFFEKEELKEKLIQKIESKVTSACWI